ncbi:MAG: hypothetical protein DDG59_07620 [Anaerolineae bacterium]|nr:MAG: hypothetical protein DDG59_07620 [Anaerolineae bacterium]
MKERVGYLFLAVIIALSGMMILAGVASASSNLEPASPDCWNTITIKKVTEPAGGTGFDFTIRWGSYIDSFTLNDQQTKKYTPNSHSVFTVTEAVKADHYLKNISCNGPTGALFNYDLQNRRVIIDLKTNKVDGNITCTFTNTRYGKITVYKFEDLDNDGQWDNEESPLSDWEFDLSGPKTGSGKTDSNGKLIFENLISGEYTVTENLEDEYTSTTGLMQNVTLNPNGAETLYFGNRRFAMDYGDLPGAYGLTLFSESGARHLPLEQGDVWLGTNRDVEYDGKPHNDAVGDDNDATNDEDGVVRGATWGGGMGVIMVTVNGPSCLMGWVDYATVTETLPTNLFKEFGFDYKFTDNFDKDGNSFSEKVIDNLLLTSAGTHEITFPLPTDFGGASVFARFRLSPAIPADGSEALNPVAENNGAYRCPSVGLTGLAHGGEVEDYVWTFGPTAIKIKQINAVQQHSALSFGWGLIGILINLSALWFIKRRRK